MANNNNPVSDEEILPFEREITIPEFEKSRIKGFLKETEIFYGKNLLIENEAPKRESYSLFGYRIVDSDFKDVIKGEVEFIQSKFNFIDMVISTSDGKTLNFSDLPITKHTVVEDANGDIQYYFSINSGKHGLFLTMVTEKDRIVLSLSHSFHYHGFIQLGELNLQTQNPLHNIRYKLHGWVKRKNSDLNMMKTQYIRKAYSSLVLPDKELSIVEENEILKNGDQKNISEGKRKQEDFIPNIDLTKITALSKTEILEILKKDQKKLDGLLKENLELNYLLKKAEINQDKPRSKQLSKERMIHLWKNIQIKLKRVLIENKILPHKIKSVERRIERLKKKKKEGIKSVKDLFLDEIKD